MKDFKSKYYINNTPWQRNLDIKNIKTFSNIKYNDIIIFHYNFLYSIFKLSSSEYDKTIFISAINICLRYYQIIKQKYPYNRTRIIIHTAKSDKFCIDYNAFRSVIDIIPDFAICFDDVSLEDFSTNNYKHIFYGPYTNKSKYPVDCIQSWSVISGKLIIN